MTELQLILCAVAYSIDRVIVSKIFAMDLIKRDSVYAQHSPDKRVTCLKYLYVR